MYLYLCEDLRPGPTELQPDEQIEPVVVPWDEAMRMVYEGQIEDAKSMLAILICDFPPTRGALTRTVARGGRLHPRV